MKYNYCTVFDKGFLSRGLALYYSVLQHHQEPFRHFMLCLDDNTYEILTKMKLAYVTPVSMKEFEDEKLLAMKKTRSFREYCWSLSSIFTHYVLTHFPDSEMVAYLDGDLFFFASPKKIFRDFEAAGNKSILIIPHNLPPAQKAKEDSVGKYNVGMLIFKNDENGRACLTWWKEKTMEWCYEKIEPGKFGDQKYLDYFEEKFKGVFVYRQKGACLAGWNIANYKGKIEKKGETVFIDGDPLLFFHFSQFKLYWPSSHWLPSGPANEYGYFMPSVEKELIYRHYTEALYGAQERIRLIDPSFTHGMIPRPSLYTQIKEVVVPPLRRFLKSKLS